MVGHTSYRTRLTEDEEERRQKRLRENWQAKLLAALREEEQRPDRPAPDTQDTNWTGNPATTAPKLSPIENSTLGAALQSMAGLPVTGKLTDADVGAIRRYATSHPDGKLSQFLGHISNG